MTDPVLFKVTKINQRKLQAAGAAFTPATPAELRDRAALKSSTTEIAKVLLPLADREEMDRKWVTTCVGYDAAYQLKLLQAVDAGLSAEDKATLAEWTALELKGDAKAIEALVLKGATDLIKEHSDAPDIAVRLLLTTLGDEPARAPDLKLRLGMFLYGIEYGLTHAAIQLGPLILEWTTDELVTVRPLSQWPAGRVSIRDHCLVTHKLGVQRTVCALPMGGDKITRKSMTALGELIVAWNKSKSYSNTGAKPSGTAVNCHAFADAVLECLGRPRWWTSRDAVGRYINALTSIATPTALVAMSPEPFLHVIDAKTNKPRPFLKHSELDGFVVDNKAEFDKRPSELLLIKSWDRAFWIQKVRRSRPLHCSRAFGTEPDSL